MKFNQFSSIYIRQSVHVCIIVGVVWLCWPRCKQNFDCLLTDLPCIDTSITNTTPTPGHSFLSIPKMPSIEQGRNRGWMFILWPYHDATWTFLTRGGR